MNRRVLLLLPPFYTPWTPPLGISLLKAHLERHGVGVTCVDLNTVPDLWIASRQYFTALLRLEHLTINDGHSKLWHVLNSHLLAYLNGAGPAECKRLLRVIIPFYGIQWDQGTLDELLPIAERYFQKLENTVLNCADLRQVGFVGTSTYTTSLASSLFALRAIKRANPHVQTVMGGGVFADDLASGSDNLQILLDEYPFVDHVVLGEGEQLLLKLVRGELADQRLYGIGDLLPGGALEMDDLPLPDFGDFDLSNYHHLTIEGSRSCPFQCTFCSETIQWGAYRKKGRGRLAQQVIALAGASGKKTFFMGDSLMNPYIAHFTQELIERRGEVLFDGYLRADKIATHEESARDWARAGLYRVRLGIESASANVLKIMQKMTAPDTISQVLKTLSGAGIRTTTYWVVGHPGEREEDFEETLRFIREHRRYIYELEAHPYYYYPYGQVGSRLYQSYELYPPKVTELVKFKMWEIVDSEPGRMERYERLKRMSEVASECGLINIYSMEERYAAEERWRTLHPLVREVYPGARMRELVQEERLEGLAPRATTDATRSLCYRVCLKKRLDPQTLTAAADIVRRHHRFLLTHSDGIECVVVSGQNGDDSDDEPGGTTVPDGLRVVLRDRGAGHDLLLVAPCLLTDARGLLLLAEDLFRAYEQLVAGVPVSLPGEHASSEVLAEALRRVETEPGGGMVRALRARRDSTPSIIRRPVDEGALAEEIGGPKARDVASELVVLALARCLERLGRPAELIINQSYRSLDGRLEKAVAPLGGLFTILSLDGLALNATASVDDHAAARRETWRAAPAVERPTVLLTLEYLHDEPHLGGTGWFPDGFLFTEGGSIGSRDVEVQPVRRGKRLELVIKHGAAAAELAEGVGKWLPCELAALATQRMNREAVRKLWQRELRSYRAASLSRLLGEAAPPAAPLEGERDLPVDTPPTIGELAAHGIDAASFFLAAYAALMSRVSGVEDLLIVCDRYLPVRLKPAWSFSFREFARQVQAQVAANRAALASVPALERGWPIEGGLLDLGFDFDPAQPRPAASGQTPGLCYEVRHEGGGIVSALRYRAGEFHNETIQALCSDLEHFLREACGNPGIIIGELITDQTTAAPGSDAVSAFADDQFSF